MNNIFIENGRPRSPARVKILSKNPSKMLKTENSRDTLKSFKMKESQTFSKTDMNLNQSLEIISMDQTIQNGNMDTGLLSERVKKISLKIPKTLPMTPRNVKAIHFRNQSVEKLKERYKSKDNFIKIQEDNQSM